MAKNINNKKYWIIIGIIAAIAVISIIIIIAGGIILGTYEKTINNQLIGGLLVGIFSLFLFISILNMGLIFINYITLKEELINAWNQTINKWKEKINKSKKKKIDSLNGNNNEETIDLDNNQNITIINDLDDNDTIKNEI